MTLIENAHETKKSVLQISQVTCACDGSRLHMKAMICTLGMSVTSCKPCRAWRSNLKATAVGIDEGIVGIGIWVQPGL